MVARSKTILYVEPSEAEVGSLERAFGTERRQDGLQVVRTGVEAMAWLAGDGAFEDRVKHPMPQLVLLDLTEARGTGLAVLRWIREQPWLGTLVVVGFTGDFQRKVVEEAYRLGANAVLLKPNRPSDLREVAQFLRLWLRLGVPGPLPAGAWSPGTASSRTEAPSSGSGTHYPLHKPQGYRTWGEGA